MVVRDLEKEFVVSEPAPEAPNEQVEAPFETSGPSHEPVPEEHTEELANGFWDLSLSDISGHLVDVLTAWPSILILAIVLFRLEISGLLKRLRSVHAKDGKFEFDPNRRLERAATIDVEPLKKPSKGSAEMEPSDEQMASEVCEVPAQDILTEQEKFLQRLIDLSPRAAVLESYMSLEKSAEGTAETLGLEEKNLRKIVNQLVYQGELPNKAVEYVQDLSRLRNQAVHVGDKDITAEDARKYVELAERLKKSLREIWGSSITEGGKAVVFRGGPDNGLILVGEWAKLASTMESEDGVNYRQRDYVVGDSMVKISNLFLDPNRSHGLSPNHICRLWAKADLNPPEMISGKYKCVKVEDGVTVMEYEPRDDGTESN